MLATLRLPVDTEYLGAALLGLVAVNVAMMRRSEYPPLYASGIRYQREPKGSEDWQTCERTLALKSGDCEDLACYRVAELIVSGDDTGARPAVIRAGKRTLHAVVRRGDGSYEDPSRRLGM